MTIYHYRLVATAAGGPVTSPDRTFTTLAPPPPAPALAFAVASRQSLHSVLHHGIKVTFSCDVACSVSFAATKASGRAVDIAAAPVVLAAGRGTLSGGGHGTVKLKLTTPGRKLFKHSSRLKIALDGSAANAAGVAGSPVAHKLTLH
jgi:hypothetical protein